MKTSTYDKLTIIITNHDGHRYLTRLLNYYSNTKFKIIVADSSDSKFSIEIQNDNIKYLHYPGMGIGEKLLNVYNQVETEFVVWNSVDDFLVEDGLIKAVDFLQNNLDYSSVHGKTLTKNKGYKLFYRERVSIENNSIQSRLDSLADDQYDNNLFSVNRTKDICNIFENMMYKYITPSYEFEMSHAIATLAHGKLKQIDNLFLIREKTPGSAGIIHKKFLLAKDKDNKNKANFIADSAGYIEKKFNLSNNEAKYLIRKIIANYIHLNLNTIKKIPNSFSLVLKFSKFLPNIIVKNAKFLLTILSIFNLYRNKIITNQDLNKVKYICSLIDSNSRN